MATIFDYVTSDNMVTGKDAFWGNYIDLNKGIIPDSSLTQDAIHEFQVKKIKQFTKSAVKKNPVAERINQLFTSGDINSLSSQLESEQDKNMEKAMEKIFENIRGFRHMLKKEEMYNKNRYQQAQQYLIQLLAELEHIQSLVSIDSAVFEEDLKKLSNLINTNRMRSFGQKDMVEWIKNLSNFQGEILEEIGTAWLATKIPADMEIIPITTGSIISNNRQLIEDIMMLNVTGAQLDNIKIKYKLGKENAYRTQKLKQFLDTMKKNNGDKMISIDDRSYQLLQHLSAFNIQAKSGQNQLPWNKNASTQVSIGEYGDDGRNLTAKRTFELIHQLYQEPPEKKWIEENNDRDQYYKALANYGLGTVLYKVLHLSRTANQYLLTQSGFITFEERMAQLYEQNNKQGIFGLSGPIFIDNTTLSHKYNVNFPTWIKK